MTQTIQIEQSDAQKILDILQVNAEYHEHRDRSNAQLHLAKEVRFSPITSETISAFERLRNLLGEQTIEI